MNKHIYNLITFTLFVLALIFTSCNEDGQIDSDDIRANVKEPQITTFSPTGGAPGAEVMLTGINLSTIDTVYIGGELAKVKNRISNTQLLIEVTSNSKSGKISIRNPRGTYESHDAFNVYVLKPEIGEIESQEAGELTVGETISISGENLLSVSSVTIGNTNSQIVFASTSKLQVLVPVITGVNKSKITLNYMDGENKVFVESVQSFNIKASTTIPFVSEAPVTALIGETITIQGSNLNTVSSASIDNKAIELESRTDSEIKLVIPTIFSVETKANLILIYNDTEQLIAVKDFVVTVPAISDEVLFYPNIVLGAENHSSEQYFFNAKNGTVYSACEYENNKNDIYFFVTSYTSGSTIQLNNPNNTNTQTPRFECNGVALNKEKMPNVVKYRILKATTKAEKIYIEHVKNRTLGKIDPSIVSEAGVSNATTSTPRAGTNFNAGDVIMFQKFDAAGINVLEVGFINITDVIIDAENLGQSSIVFDCFFQK